MEDTELLKTLIDAVAGVPDHVPDGWKTAEQWASVAGISAGQMRRKLNAAAIAGRMVQRNFMVRVGVKTIPISHYSTEVPCERPPMMVTKGNGPALWAGMRKERREASSQPKPSHY